MKLVTLPPEDEGQEALSSLRFPARERKAFPWSLAAGLLLVAFAVLPLRSYTIGIDLPYFYNEDEAHHFNRVVEMVQAGDYNPHYFLKPSLHFYLRMPVVAASFLWTVRNGHIRSIQDIETRDRFGLSGYSLTASHPGIVKWNRALSVLFALGIVLASGCIAYLLTASVPWSILAASLTGVSPGLIEYGGVIGVDMPVSFFCTITVALALLSARLQQRPGNLLALIMAGIAAGFAVSTKYNALPVALVPCIAVLCSMTRSIPRTIIALLLPGIAFFAASPFILVSLPLFLDHFAYEIWHYGQAAHEGYSANPGLEQIWFYGSWLLLDGLGPIAFILAVVGIFEMRRERTVAPIVLAFPLLYFGLMISQKTHFERNMLLLIGILPACFAYALFQLQRTLQSPLLRNVFLSIALVASLAPMLYRSIQNRSVALAQSVDSRQEASLWLKNHTPALFDTALEGELQLPSFQVFQAGIAHNSVTGLKRLGRSSLDAFDLFQKGYRRIVVGPDFLLPAAAKPFFDLEYSIAGQDELQRVPRNPAIRILRFSEKTILDPTRIIEQLLKTDIEIPVTKIPCAATEDHCWVSTRISRLHVPTQQKLSIFSPWGVQTIQFFDSTLKPLQSLTVSSEPIEFVLPAHHDDLYLYVPEVHVPSHHSESSDIRRLGIALSVPGAPS